MVFKNFLPKAKEIDILSNLPDGLLLIDSSGMIQNANDFACSFFETGKTEMLRNSVNDLIEGGFDLVKQAALSAKSVVGKVKSKTEKELFLEITGRYTEDFIVVTLRDVTQNYKVVSSILVEQESSKKCNKDKNAFLVKLSNELKSPLQSVIGFSQAMIDGLGGQMSEKQDKYVKIINKNSNELLYLIEKIVEFSKTESNLFDSNQEVFDGINAIQSILKTFEPQFTEKNLNITYDSSEMSKRTIFTDEGLLKMALHDIFETAIKSTDIGSISVKLSYPELDEISTKGLLPQEGATSQSYWMIKITDTGAGIPETDLVTIFEPYIQLEKPNKKNIVRSIALASAKNIVRYLKGTMWVDSEPMQGTTYYVIIPVEKM